ncbi:PAC2 family protein [soil metagenome]
MDHVRWSRRPTLRKPVVVAAFEGWNDAGDAATTAARWFSERWGGETFAVIDPEEFYDFTSTRPQVHLAEGMQREIVWPGNELSSMTVPGTERDVVVLLGTEPQLRWRTFCDQVVDVARAHDASLVITLGALLAEVAHTRPVSVIGTGYDREMVERLQLVKSTYEGPTGIVGVLHDACHRAGLASASLWAAVPTYVPGAPSPKAALALVERTSEMLEVPVITTDLEIASASYERQISELVDADEETAAYVAQLEQRHDAGDTSTGTSLIDEVERFLRDQ